MDRYGTDKPDLRNPLHLTDLTDLMRAETFQVFRAAADHPNGRVAALRLPGGGDRIHPQRPRHPNRPSRPSRRQRPRHHKMPKHRRPRATIPDNQTPIPTNHRRPSRPHPSPRRRPNLLRRRRLRHRQRIPRRPPRPSYRHHRRPPHRRLAPPLDNRLPPYSNAKTANSAPVTTPSPPPS